MRLSHKNRDRHAHRIAIRQQIQNGTYGKATEVKPAFVVGQKVLIRSTDYGQRYVNRSVEIVEFNGSDIVKVQAKGRKSLFDVRLIHVEAA